MLETGFHFDRIPFATIGDARDAIIVLNGGQAFVRRPSPERTLRDAKRLQRLLPKGRSYTLLGYDQAFPAGYNLDSIVADVARILRASGGPRQVIGISYGGLVAARLAAAHPDLVSDLVLLVSAHYFSDEGLRRIRRQIAHAANSDFNQLIHEFAAVFRRPWFNWLLALRIWSQRRTQAQTMNDPDIIVRGLSTVSALDPDPSWLRHIQARTLVIGGDADQFFGDGRMQETAGLIACARLALFSGETHMVPVERGAAVAKAMIAFLEGRP